MLPPGQDTESLIPGEEEEDAFTYEFSSAVPLEIERGTHSLKQSTWLHSSTIIVGEIMGTGVMGLPAATAKLGEHPNNQTQKKRTHLNCRVGARAWILHPLWPLLKLFGASAIKDPK